MTSKGDKAIASMAALYRVRCALLSDLNQSYSNGATRWLDNSDTRDEQYNLIVKCQTETLYLHAYCMYLHK